MLHWFFGHLLGNKLQTDSYCFITYQFKTFFYVVISEGISSLINNFVSTFPCLLPYLVQSAFSSLSLALADASPWLEQQ